MNLKNLLWTLSLDQLLRELLRIIRRAGRCGAGNKRRQMPGALVEDMGRVRAQYTNLD